MPIFQVKRTVRGFPDEADWYSRTVYNSSLPNGQSLRYFRLGRFGFMDYENYAENGIDINDNNTHGFCLNGSRREEFDYGYKKEVEDLYQLSSPIGSGYLVYHHFEVENLIYH